MKPTIHVGNDGLRRAPAKPAQRLRLTALAGALAVAFVTPAFAASDIEMLKEELMQQRKALEHQQQMIDKLEKRLAEQAAAPAAKPGMVAALTKGDTPVMTIYGILDSGVEHITNIGADKKSLTRVPPITATLPSRIGFKLHKEFKPGFAAIGTLEAGFNLDDGNSLQGGRIFGRQLFAGLQTPVGSFTFGRQWSMLTLAMRGTDKLGPNVYALGSLDSYLPNSRYDNSLAWQHKFGSVSAGVAYSLGRDTSGGAPASGTCAGEQVNINDTQECKAWSAMVRYDSPRFGVAGAIDRVKGGTGATAFFFNGAPPFTFSSSSDKDTRITLGGYVNFGAASVGAGWLGRKVETNAKDVESDTYYVTASYQLTPVIKLDGGIHRITNDDQNRDATLTALRAFYTLDKGLDVYGQVGHISNSSNASYQLSVGPGIAPAAGESQNGYMMGLRYIF
jgi:predicted porin